MRKSSMKLLLSSKKDFPVLLIPKKGRVLVSAIKLLIFSICSCLIMFVDATSILYQLQNVVRRNNTALWRSPDYVFTRLFVHALIPLCISLSFLNLGNSVRDLQYRVFAMWVYHLYVKGCSSWRRDDGRSRSFWIIILPAIISNSSLSWRLTGWPYVIHCLVAQIEPMFIFNRSLFVSCLCIWFDAYDLLLMQGVFIRGSGLDSSINNHCTDSYVQQSHLVAFILHMSLRSVNLSERYHTPCYVPSCTGFSRYATM